MAPFSVRSFLGFVSAVSVTWIALACGGSTTGEGTAQQGVKPGAVCTTEGASEAAADGCNTCTCSGGAWSCTEKGCSTDPGPTPTQDCTPGTSKDAGDGCNTCSCGADGRWLCTRSACVAPGECIDGETQGNCNECTCVSGAWQCSKVACPTPQCKPGETMNDGCNSCGCDANGLWSCTLRYCPPAQDGGSAQPKGCGGWLGDTCTETEYCAYTEGQYCGAADASATCAPRPSVCTKEYAPVCGCDGVTYSNACVAASAGTGVLSSGPCAN